MGRGRAEEDLHGVRSDRDRLNDNERVDHGGDRSLGAWRSSVPPCDSGKPGGRALARLRPAGADRVLLGLFIAYPFVEGVLLSLTNARVGVPGRLRRPRELRQDLERQHLPDRRLEHLLLYGRHHGLQAGARPVAGDAAQPPFQRQGVHPRLHPAALHHPDGAVDLRLEVDVRPDLQRHQLVAVPARPDHRPHQLAGRSRPRHGLDHRRQHLARRAVLRHQPAGRPADHQPRAATRPPRSTAPGRGSASGTSPGRCCCRSPWW